MVPTTTTKIVGLAFLTSKKNKRIIMWICPLCRKPITTPTPTLHNNNNEYRAFSPCCIQCSINTNTNTNMRTHTRCSSLCSRPCNSLCSSLCNTLRITFRISNRRSMLLLPGLGFLSDTSPSFSFHLSPYHDRYEFQASFHYGARGRIISLPIPYRYSRYRLLPRPGRHFFFTTYRLKAD
jgi:hypothetical protein